MLDCSQSPIFSWDRLGLPRLTATAILILGTLRYSGRGRGRRQPEVKCSILGTN